ncbi:hypothetical protein FWG86_02645, partial [Candidatus Saccharibacteria bacterium]|nr:hypothetical protein [Candidatus Saccharibacteria bacterium]
GDLCWMETNLAYAGGGDDTYNDTISGMTLGSTANDNIASGQACYGGLDATDLCYWIPPNANRTSGTTQPSTSTDGGATSPQYGYLYSWCTALNGQAPACSSTDATPTNPNVNGSTIYNVCPSGWRLPTSGGTGNEFVLLNNTINGGIIYNPNSNPPDVGLFAQGLYMYAGNFSNGSFSNQGSSGYYWGSTNASNGFLGFGLLFSSGAITTPYNNAKGYGQSVRCVAP